VSIHVANLTVVARLRGAECRLPGFHTETQRNYQGNCLGKLSREQSLYREVLQPAAR